MLKTELYQTQNLFIIFDVSGNPNDPYGLMQIRTHTVHTHILHIGT